MIANGYALGLKSIESVFAGDRPLMPFFIAKAIDGFQP